MDFKAVIFDFDGTIADSLHAALRIGNRLAPEYGYRPVQPGEIETLRRMPYRKIAAHIGIAWHKIPRVATRVRSELSSRLEEVQPIAGLPRVLSELRARNFRLGILSSNARSNVQRFLDAHELDDFEFINTASSVWGKQRRLKAVLKSRQLAARDVVYVGDEVRDIEATKALGVRVIAVAWGYTAREYLAAHEPDHLIDRPEELLQILRGNNQGGSEELVQRQLG
jgi:phosphoglycolate phosphatase